MHLGKTTFAAILGWMASCSLVIAADTPPAGAAGVPEAGQHAQRLEKAIVVKLDYLLSLPADYGKESNKKWPLLLFLHGAGERGSDINVVKKHGPPKLVVEQPEGALATQFIVLSPQCPLGGWWKSYELIALLDDVTDKYQVDTDRVYCTGLSMGGYGTWELAAVHPDRFAAVVPICGGGRIEMAKRMRTLPIWIFHGDADSAVPVQSSIDMAKALESKQGNVKLTIYPGVKHDSWTQTYANPELYTWLLSHKLSDRPAPEPRDPVQPKPTAAPAAATNN